MKNIKVFLIYLVTISCEFVITKMPERTFSIRESVEKNVFVAEYIPNERNVSLNDTINFEFQEVWLEFPWWYINQRKDIEIKDSLKGKILFRFKNNTDQALYDKGVKMWCEDVQYSGFNNIYFELNNINFQNSNNTFTLKIALYDNQNIIDSTSVKLNKKE